MSGSERIKSDIEFLRKISEVCPAGTTRLSYTKQYKQAADFVKAQMKQAGLEILEDGIGNIFGKLSGTEKNLPVILSGSHLDTVICAGAFDGIAGVACALEAARMLAENKQRLRHSLAVAALVEEEGSRFGQACMGSSFATGVYGEKELDSFTDGDGISLRTALSQYHPKTFAAPFKTEEVIGKLKAFLELHSEQGPVLEKENIDVGIVDKIVCVCWLSVTVNGFAGHAGTVPMLGRRDAGIAAFRMIDAVNRFVVENFPTSATVTVGKLELQPNSPNCIPSRCTFSFDLRSPDPDIIEKMVRRVEREAAETERQNGVTVEVSSKMRVTPAPLDSGLQTIIENSCVKLGFTKRRINSGAGHDAMIFASFTKSAMIFIPCKDGVTHNPLEEMSYAALEKGAKVLYETILQVDKT